MNPKLKILIAGVGGVGGFLGARLALNKNAEVHFLCRGEHLKAILAKGIMLEESGRTSTTRPESASDNCSLMPEMDIILLCTKSYSLDEICLNIKSCTGKKTVLIPLLNGLGHETVIRKYFPENIILKSCIYIVSKYEAPGHIVFGGKTHRWLIDANIESIDNTSSFSRLSGDAGINLELHSDIESRLWEKFCFISALASYTSAGSVNTGQICSDPEHRLQLMELFKEVVLLAQITGINIPSDITNKYMQQIENLPPGTTSSMERDFALHKKSEFESLCGYVVRNAAAHNLKVPAFEKCYKILKEKEAENVKLGL